MTESSDGRTVVSLVCRVGRRFCALPLDGVVETMRSLPVESISGAQGFVRGVSIIRGAPVPVVDAAALLTGEGGDATRFVTIDVGGRLVALALQGVVGVREIETAAMATLPPLIDDVAGEVVASIGTLDGEFLLLLHGARLLPDDVWPLLGEGEPVA